MQTRFTYRVTSLMTGGAQIGGSGRVEGSDFNDMVRYVMRTAGVTTLEEKYGAGSAMEGATWRTQFMRNGVPVTLSISPCAENFAGA